MISSAGSCERNWSTYNIVHSKLRNRLLPQRANKLVYCHYNLRLAKKIEQPEKFAEWHGGEDMDI
jgi:hypothetical protein